MANHLRYPGIEAYNGIVTSRESTTDDLVFEYARLYQQHIDKDRVVVSGDGQAPAQPVDGKLAVSTNDLVSECAQLHQQQIEKDRVTIPRGGEAPAQSVACKIPVSTNDVVCEYARLYQQHIEKDRVTTSGNGKPPAQSAASEILPSTGLSKRGKGAAKTQPHISRKNLTTIWETLKRMEAQLADIQNRLDALEQKYFCVKRDVRTDTGPVRILSCSAGASEACSGDPNAEADAGAVSDRRLEASEQGSGPSESISHGFGPVRVFSFASGTYEDCSGDPDSGAGAGANADSRLEASKTNTIPHESISHGLGPVRVFSFASGTYEDCSGDPDSGAGAGANADSRLEASKTNTIPHESISHGLGPVRVFSFASGTYEDGSGDLDSAAGADTTSEDHYDFPVA
jgi:hypothetical protein